MLRRLAGPRRPGTALVRLVLFLFILAAVAVGAWPGGAIFIAPTRP